MREANTESYSLLELFKRMIWLRLTEEAIAKAYPMQEIRCPVHLCIGQEAVSVGAAVALMSGDSLFGTHRSHGPYVARGGDIGAMLAEIYGKVAGCSGGRGGSMHLADLAAGFWGAVPIVASTIPIATGMALGFQMRGEKRVSMVVFGEGATEEGVFSESIQYAALKKLPIVYVCENNAFAVNTPLEERRPAGFCIGDVARAYGLATATGDGNDADCVYRLCHKAVERARRGEGASYMEFATYRWVEHCGPADDSHLPCRSAEELEKWRRHCPIRNMERKILADGLATAEALEAITTQIGTEIDEAMCYAQSAPFPKQDSAATGVYAPTSTFYGGPTHA